MAGTDHKLAHFVVTALQILLSSALEAPANAQQHTAAVRSTATTNVPSRTIVGVVYDSKTGAGLGGALVNVRDTEIGVVSDSLGRFRLNPLPVGPQTIVVQYIGYQDAEVPIDVTDNRGIALQIGISVRILPVCSLVVCAGPYPCNSAEVFVRDIMTGVAPQVPVKLRVIGELAADSLSVIATRDADYVRLGAGSSLTGREGYRIEVSASGYQTWLESGVRRNLCGAVIGSPFRVWLVPRLN